MNLSLLRRLDTQCFSRRRPSFLRAGFGHRDAEVGTFHGESQRSLRFAEELGSSYNNIQ